MVSVNVSKYIEAPPAEVWEVFTDLEHAAENIRAIEKLELLTPGPVGKGTRFRETRIMFKKEATEEMEITGWEPGKSYTVSAGSHGAQYTTVFRFVPEGRGTRVECEFGAVPVSFFAKLMSPLGKLMAGTMRKLMDRDFEDLKQLAEARVKA
jgi:carbon monoxide dehydrogenase subunit G